MSKIQPEQMPPPAYPGGPAQYNSPGTAFGVQTGYATQHVTLINQPIVSVVQRFTNFSVRTTCPGCRADIMTATSYEVGTFAWLAAAFICIIGFWLFCFLIPFCLDDCKDVIHTCPNCNTHIARHSRL